MGYTNFTREGVPGILQSVQLRKKERGRRGGGGGREVSSSLSQG